MLKRNLLSGAVAGFAATAPMTAAMVAMHRFLPPQERYPLPPRHITEELAEEAGVNDQLSEPQRRAATMVNHFAYGAAAGALYAPLARNVPAHPLVKGIAFGLTVWTVSYLGLLPAAGILSPATRHPARRNALMIAAHVVWGAATGVLADRLDSRR